mgnify:CR=1 FL=1
MEQIKEAVYLINDERYLHLRENGAGVGFATYNKVTGEPLESGQISEKNLPPDGQKHHFLPLGTGICLNFRTMTARSSNRKA